MAKDKQPESPLILLIEDDENDVFFFRRALARAGWKGDVRVIGSATQAWNYMEGRLPFSDRSHFPLPQLIVSDFRLAGHTALDFGMWLRSQPALADIPVVIFSGGVSGPDVEKMACFCPKAIIAKTGDVAKLAEALGPFLP